MPRFQRTKHAQNRWGKLVNVRQSIAAQRRFARQGPPRNWQPFRRGHTPWNKGVRTGRFPRRHKRVRGRGYVSKAASMAAKQRIARSGFPRGFGPQNLPKARAALRRMKGKKGKRRRLPTSGMPRKAKRRAPVTANVIMGEVSRRGRKRGFDPVDSFISREAEQRPRKRRRT